MTLNALQFRYDNAPAIERVQRLRGAGDVSAIFGEHHLLAPTPWPRAPRSKTHREYDPERVYDMLRRPPVLTEFDPVNLHATQRNITRGGVMYYMTPEYQRTGRTHADQADPGNRYPVVYSRDTGENLLLSGHHRATAALLKDTPLRARQVQGGLGPPRGAR